MSAGLEVRDVVVHYRDDDGTRATAVDGVSLDVAPGEVVALLGPSGSGKSSLLRAVAGLEPVSGGRVAWDGVDLRDVPVHRRNFGLMFQDGQLFPHRDVARNVSFGLEMAGVDRSRRRALVAELLELVGLEGFERREVATLSGGERQRVALARSLAPRPRLLLLDEPLSALDRGLRERLAGEVRAALIATGTTAVFVTHDHDEAFAVADRIAVMDAGHLLQIAPPAELWHRSASRTVAKFLGYEAFVAADSPAGAALAVAVGVGREGLGQAPVDRDVGPFRSDRGLGSGRSAAAPHGHPVPAGALLALGPGSLRRDDHGPLRGHVLGAAFRRGLVELVVAVDGVGTLTVVEPGGGYDHGGPSGPADVEVRSPGVGVPSPGAEVALRPEVAGIAIVSE